MTNDKRAPSPWLLHQWTMAGIIAAGARFIPIPFVDELVQSRCRRFVINQTLAAHHSTLSAKDVASFYSTSGGCRAGCLGMVVRAPLKVLLFPVRKVVTIFTSVRGVPLEIMRTVLMGRTLDRYLTNGKIGESTSSAVESTSRALQMRTAFEIAFAQMDWRAVRAAVKDALGAVDQWKVAAVDSAKQVFDQKDDEVEQLETRPAVQASAEQVEKVLQRSETLTLFAEFDRRFDEAMQNLDEQRPA